MSDHARLKAPAEHLGVLVEPERCEVPGDAARRFADVQIGGRSLAAWRAQLRNRLELTAPVIMTGHQAEFFHAGVFAKNFAAHHLAMQVGGSPLFLFVDSDLPKRGFVAAPHIGPQGLEQRNIPIPQVDLLRAVECQPRVPDEVWAQFFAALEQAMPDLGNTLLPAFRDAWFSGSNGGGMTLLDGLERAWAAVERELGYGELRHLRMSALSDAPEFRAFALQLMRDARMFAEAHNAAQNTYRQRHGVKTPTRPVPPLQILPDRIELPLWVYQCGGRRARLFVGQTATRLRVYAGTELLAELDTAAQEAILASEPWPAPLSDWHLRPRALLLSCFCRLFLADLFIHGIGGAKYDEVMEEFVQAYLGIPPAPQICVTATLHLPLPRTSVTVEDVRRVQRNVRDARFNPQRHMSAPPEALLHQRAEFIRLSELLRAEQPADRGRRRNTFETIRRLNGELLAREPGLVERLERKTDSLREDLKREHVVQNREYFTALHSREVLRRLGEQIRAAVVRNEPAPIKTTI